MKPSVKCAVELGAIPTIQVANWLLRNQDKGSSGFKEKDLSPVSMKMPATEPAGEGWEVAVLEKIFLYGKATEAIEEAFSHFVSIWSDDGKKANEAINIEKWVKRELGV